MFNYLFDIYIVLYNVQFYISFSSPCDLHLCNRVFIKQFTP